MEDKRSKQDFKSFIWKGEKIATEDGYIQDKKLLIDMNEQELNRVYKHCINMLYSDDRKNPGRYIVLEQIEEQIKRCGAELFVRDLSELLDKDKILMEINTRLGSEYEDKIASDLFDHIEEGFENIPISYIIDVCKNKNKIFNKTHLTRNFILSQGIWLSDKELSSFNIDSKVNKLDTIRDLLNLHSFEKLKSNPDGLSYEELRSMITLKSSKKYSELTSIQLVTLFCKELPLLMYRVKIHIASWLSRIETIKEAADYLEYNLDIDDRDI
jgi:hypothetical protein